MGWMFLACGEVSSPGLAISKTPFGKQRVFVAKLRPGANLQHVDLPKDARVHLVCDSIGNHVSLFSECCASEQPCLSEDPGDLYVRYDSPL